MFFPKRKPEPKEMGKLEHKAFSDLSRDNYKRWFIPLVDNALAWNLPKDARVLDVGSGPGFLSKEIASRSKHFHIVGIDTSSDALAIAKRNFSSLKNVSFKKASVYRLPFTDNSFDLVICKDSFHHFDKPQGALKEMWRVLKPKGILYIQDLRRDVPMYLLRRSIPRQSVVQKLQYYSVRAAFTKNETRAFLKSHKPRMLVVKTRKLAKRDVGRYKKMGINLKLLREAFQSRYIALARK